MALAVDAINGCGPSYKIHYRLTKGTMVVLLTTLADDIRNSIRVFFSVQH